jgi:Protein of unknown function (DUF3386)
MRSCTIPLAMLTLAALATPASAHFLFARIRPAAEGGRAAEVYFSEYASAGDPRYIDKVASAQFWMTTGSSGFQPLAMRKLSDRLRANVPLEGPVVVAGRLDYGVLARPGETPFLLRHFSKAVAGKSDELNAMPAKGDHMEVVATFEKGKVVLAARLDGKPIGNTTFFVVDADLSTEELKADGEGRATFEPERPGTFSVYVQHVDKSEGEYKGKAYREIREFATITFSWPLVASATDPEAVKAFTSALAARAVWQDFPGFTAKIAGQVEERPFDGKVTVDRDGGVKLDLTDDVLQSWAQEQLESITMHRAAGQRSTEPPTLRFADDDTENPLGRLLAFEGGQFASSYRVKDNQITVVNRFLDGQNMTITVLDNEKNAEGLFLPRSYTVRYWDGASGKLDRMETVHDRWTRLGKWDLPLEHVVTASSDGGFSSRSFRLSDHELSAPSNATGAGKAK